MSDTGVTLPPFLSVQSDGVTLAIRLQPRASANELGEPLGDELRVRVTAPPVDSAANEALLKFLVEKLDCSKNQLQLVRGQTSRHKIVRIHGISAQDVLTKLR